MSSTVSQSDRPLDPAGVAAALQVSIGTFMRRLRQSPVRGDLTTPELAALSRLDRGGPATPSARGLRAEQISPRAVGVTLAGLERRGLIQRSPEELATLLQAAPLIERLAESI